MSAPSAKSRFWFTWGWPLAMAVLSVVGLLSALLGNGVWDWVSWVALGVPTLACCWLGLRRKRPAS
ncbi:MAG: hypothetical protein KA795_00355 [Burkholderiaceae bacterium]|nr:hypothetical protein [Burkholderiaceae bacterium]